ncbi:Hypothetical predicted protein, partial [Pelobates cultripes]
GVLSRAIVKGCVTKNIPCDYMGSLDVGGANASTFKVNIECCNEDKCNTFNYK